MSKLKIADKSVVPGDVTVLYKSFIPRLWAKLRGKSQVEQIFLENVQSQLITTGRDKVSVYSLRKPYSNKETTFLLKLNTEVYDNTTVDILTIINAIRPNTIVIDPTKDITQLDNSKYYTKHDVKFSNLDGAFFHNEQ